MKSRGPCLPCPSPCNILDAIIDHSDNDVCAVAVKAGVLNTQVFMILCSQRLLTQSDVNQEAHSCPWHTPSSSTAGFGQGPCKALDLANSLHSVIVLLTRRRSIVRTGVDMP